MPMNQPYHINPIKYYNLYNGKYQKSPEIYEHVFIYNSAEQIGTGKNSPFSILTAEKVADTSIESSRRFCRQPALTDNSAVKPL